MVLVAYVEKGIGGQGLGMRKIISKADVLTPKSQPLIPVLGIPACGLHDKTTVFDLLLPRVLAAEKIGREELAELGYGGLCMHCPECRYPVCPFGKA
jgi:hypothetical protein